MFSIAMGAEYLSYVKSIATFALTSFGCIILVLANVDSFLAGLVWVEIECTVHVAVSTSLR